VDRAVLIGGPQVHERGQNFVFYLLMRTYEEYVTMLAMYDLHSVLSFSVKQ
jgi:hypothetical protein